MHVNLPQAEGTCRRNRYIEPYIYICYYVASTLLVLYYIPPSNVFPRRRICRNGEILGLGSYTHYREGRRFQMLTFSFSRRGPVPSSDVSAHRASTRNRFCPPATLVLPQISSTRRFSRKYRCPCNSHMSRRS